LLILRRRPQTAFRILLPWGFLKAHLQRQLPAVVLVSWVWGQGPDADTIPRKLEKLPNLYTVPLKDELEESPKHVRQK
jgi:hypothetical protein